MLTQLFLCSLSWVSTGLVGLRGGAAQQLAEQQGDQGNSREHGNVGKYRTGNGKLQRLSTNTGGPKIPGAIPRVAGEVLGGLSTSTCGLVVLSLMNASCQEVWRSVALMAQILYPSETFVIG